MCPADASLPEAARENAIQACETAAQQTIDALTGGGRLNQA